MNKEPKAKAESAGHRARVDHEAIYCHFFLISLEVEGVYLA